MHTHRQILYRSTCDAVRMHIKQQVVFLHPDLTHLKFRLGGEITGKITYHTTEDSFSFLSFFFSPSQCWLWVHMNCKNQTEAKYRSLNVRISTMQFFRVLQICVKGFHVHSPFSLSRWLERERSLFWTAVENCRVKERDSSTYAREATQLNTQGPGWKAKRVGVD